MMHQCPRCGNPTDGAYSQGGLKWAICDECMEREWGQQEREQEEREAIRAVNKGEWFNDDGGI